MSKDFLQKILLGEEFRRAINEVRKKDNRYEIEAYHFIFEALNHTLSKIGQRRHISGKELLEGIKDLAIKEFGYMSRIVFERWGVESTEDFGQMVFNLVDSGLMGKTDTDTIEDFKDVYDFKKVFEDSYDFGDIVNET